jgi:two-component system, OmpR family, KDP operon response regulator KdpE
MMQRRKLLVIDEDPAIFRYLRRGLKREDYDVASAPRHGMLARMDEWQPDVILLDLALPHDRSQIQAIKARSPAPLIGLLPHEDTQAMIAALDAGVHDCVPKPFSLEELAAHIYKVLRRDMWCRGEISEFKSPTLRIDLVLRRVYRDDRTVALSRRQFQLLKLLLDADGRVLTYRNLMDAIWGPGDGGSIASLRRMIQELRRKIEPDPRQPVHILSQSRLGYRFARPPHGR